MTNTNLTIEAIEEGSNIIAEFERLMREASRKSEAVENLRAEVVTDFMNTKRAYPFSIRTLRVFMNADTFAEIFHTSRGVVGGYIGNMYRAYEKALKNASGDITRAEALNIAKPFARNISALKLRGVNNAEYTAPILNDSAIRALMKEHVKKDAKRATATADVKHFAEEVAKAYLLKLYGTNYSYTYYDTTATATEKANAEKDAERAKKRAEAKKVSDAKKNGTHIKDGKTMKIVKVIA